MKHPHFALFVVHLLSLPRTGAWIETRIPAGCLYPARRRSLARERGLKPVRRAKIPGERRRSLARERGLKPSGVIGLCSAGSRSLARERGLKRQGYEATDPGRGRSLARERRLKPDLPQAAGDSDSRSLARERGLKPFGEGWIVTPLMSLPRTGAWIETRSRRTRRLRPA